MQGHIIINNAINQQIKAKYFSVKYRITDSQNLLGWKRSLGWKIPMNKYLFLGRCFLTAPDYIIILT